jgi:hypothetical protein
MYRKPRLARCLLIFSFTPSLLILLFGYRQEEERQALARYRVEEQKALVRHYEVCYDKITKAMPEFNIEEFLGGKGIDVIDPAWPKMVGELPEYETEIGKLTIKLPRRLALVARIDGWSAPQKLVQVV